MKKKRYEVTLFFKVVTLKVFADSCKDAEKMAIQYIDNKRTSRYVVKPETEVRIMP